MLVCCVCCFETSRLHCHDEPKLSTTFRQSAPTVCNLGSDCPSYFFKFCRQHHYFTPPVIILDPFSLATPTPHFLPIITKPTSCHLGPKSATCFAIARHTFRRRCPSTFEIQLWTLDTISSFFWIQFLSLRHRTYLFTSPLRSPS